MLEEGGEVGGGGKEGVGQRERWWRSSGMGRWWGGVTGMVWGVMSCEDGRGREMSGEPWL